MALRVELAKWYLSLAPASAPDYWRSPRPLERACMEYDDELAGGFRKWFPQLDVRGKDVFDVGCGYGGRSIRYAELGARSVTGLEIVPAPLIEASQFAVSHGIHNTRFLLALGEHLPFADASFDIVTSYDVFEHVCDLAQTIRECLRVLRPGGALYAVFPPFHHPTGAHLEGWLSKMPWANVWFRPATLVSAANQIIARRADGFRPNALRPTDKLWNLNGATIHGTRRLLAEIGCQYTIELAPLFSSLNSKWTSWRMKYYAWAFAPLRHIPVVNEMFTHRIVLAVQASAADHARQRRNTTAA